VPSRASTRRSGTSRARPTTHRSTNSSVVPSTLEHADGTSSLPSDPGLGVTIDEALVRERSEVDVEWHDTDWRHDDGSVAEW
jgi:hypothetical protein